VLAALALSYLRDDLRTRSGAARLSAWEYGRGTAESAARTAQMITAPSGKLGVCAGNPGGHSLPRRSRIQIYAQINPRLFSFCVGVAETRR
jgi:hypothetical protein